MSTWAHIRPSARLPHDEKASESVRVSPRSWMHTTHSQAQKPFRNKFPSNNHGAGKRIGAIMCIVCGAWSGTTVCSLLQAAVPDI